MIGFRIFISVAILVISFRSIDFMYQSLNWSLEYCFDMILMKYFAWEFEKSKLPFLDFYTYNLQFTIYLNWFWMKLFGETDFSFRVLDNLWYLLLAVSSYFYFKRYSFFAKFLAFSLVLTLNMNATNFGAFQRESMILVFWIFGLYSFEKIIYEKKFKIHFPLIGIYLALSLFIKPTSIFLFGIYFLYLIYLEFYKKDFFDLRINFLVTLFYFFIIVFFLFLPFIIENKFSSSISNWYSYFQDLNSSLELKNFSELTNEIFNFKLKDWSRPLNGFSSEQEYFVNPGRFGLLSILSVLVSIFLLYKKEISASSFILLTSSFGNYYIQRKGFTYHLFPLWISFIFLHVQVLNYFYKNMSQKNLKEKFLSIFIILFYFISFFMMQDRSLRRYLGTGLYSKKIFRMQNLPNSITFSILSELNSNLNKKIRFQNFETYHSISLYSAMKFNFEIISKFPEAYLFYSTDPKFDKYKIEMMEALKKNPPDILLISPNGAFQSKKSLYKSFPELKEFLVNYKLYKSYTELSLVEYEIYVKN